MTMKKQIFAALLLLLGVYGSFAQERKTDFCVPFNFELFLSGNFAELRSNHFHSGLDFKTQGAVGKPILSVADGYICRATVQPGGYGLALYVRHDNGYMTVYGHLDRFPQAVAKRVRDYQYEKETYSADVSFSPNELRVKKGEVLAYSGNSGYSFGPHLHFEVRDSTGSEWYDPMIFYKDKLKDTRPPRASAFALYPSPGCGAVCGSSSSKVIEVKDGAVADTLDAWGWIGLGVKALDYMDGTNNRYGVYGIELRVDGRMIYSSRMACFSSDENRLINAWTDYPRYVNEGVWFQRMYRLGNNPLRAIETDAENGMLCVDEERLYRVECRLYDYHGNASVYHFNIRGKMQDISQQTGQGARLWWYMNNSVELEGLRLDVPAGELFENVMLNAGEEQSRYGISGRYLLGEEPVPLWHGAVLSLKVNEDSVADVSKLYIESFTSKGRYALRGEYRDGWVTADIKAIAGFEVAVDSVAPLLTPLNEKRWARNGKVVFKVEEKETSVSSFRGTLNGKFVLFEYSSKNGRIVLDLKKENIRRGEHLLRLEVVDACGNTGLFEKKIKY